MGDQRVISDTGDFLVVVCHALYSPWKEILSDGQLKTWAKPETPHVVHAHGIPAPKNLRKLDILYWDLKWSKRWGQIVTLAEYVLSPLINRKIPNVHTSQMQLGVSSVVVEMSDFNFLMNKKTIALLKYGATQNFKYIIFTTSSSYINLPLLRTKLAELPSTNLVSGRLIERNGEIFPSGSFRVFSPDVLVKTLEHLQDYKFWLPEDLALGSVLSNINVNYVEIKSMDLETLETIDNLSRIDLESVPHFRLKSEIQGKRIDVELMRRLHNRITNQVKI